MARILLIDDDLEFSTFLRALMERSGHHVECFENPRGAPERLADASCDVVLLDNLMPCMSGIESFG